MYALNIHFRSLQLNRNIVGNNEKVRITVTAFPNHTKSSFTIEAKKMINLDHTFTINVTSETKAVLFLLEKKSFFQNDPIIASNVIEKKDFPISQNDTKNTEIKTFCIYEPISNTTNKTPNVERKIYGNMILQFNLSDPVSAKKSKNNYNIKKIHKGNGYAQVNDENNLNQNNLLLDDDFYN